LAHGSHTHEPAGALVVRSSWVERSFGAAHPVPQLPAAHQPQYITIKDSKRSRHMAVVGNPGSGKSRLFEYVAIQEIGRRLEGRSERGIIVFDVHGDLYRNLRSRLAVLALKYPQLYDWLVPIDPLNFFDLEQPATWTAAVDLLTPYKTQLPYDRAEMLADAVSVAYGDDPTVTVLQREVSRHVFQLLILHPQLTLRDFTRVLRDTDFRHERLWEVEDTELRDYWLKEFPHNDPKEARQMVGSSLRRVSPVVSNPRLMQIFGRKGTVNMRELLDRGAIVLIHAPAGILSKGSAYLMCALLMAELQAAAMSRVDTPEHLRRPALVIADEYLAYTTDTLTEIITQSRKFRLELVLGSQEVISGGGES
jgi:hypothetical protein